MRADYAENKLVIKDFLNNTFLSTIWNFGKSTFSKNN